MDVDLVEPGTRQVSLNECFASSRVGQSDAEFRCLCGSRQRTDRARARLWVDSDPHPRRGGPGSGLIRPVRVGGGCACPVRVCIERCLGCENRIESFEFCIVVDVHRHTQRHCTCKFGQGLRRRVEDDALRCEACGQGKVELAGTGDLASRADICVVAQQGSQRHGFAGHGVEDFGVPRECRNQVLVRARDLVEVDESEHRSRIIEYRRRSVNTVGLGTGSYDTAFTG
ncbi:hypothetical protein BAUR9175_00722 [Brevibacterium aurantiacum]|uniref:Uncharacterized protein n=1 Tax=Brevibacterium aurantiacum TaxID=273384 RepID=A0A2H1HZH6_BREAU|nr:hypothetical protein BAUR9175_00722 [Brevibacterium aurantiacum]